MKPSKNHIKLLKLAEDGDSMFGAVSSMGGLTEATVQRLYYELFDAHMIDSTSRDEPMTLTHLGRAVLKGGVGTFRMIRKPKPLPSRAG
jgi:hypothetical protein